SQQFSSDHAADRVGTGCVALMCHQTLNLAINLADHPALDRGFRVQSLKLAYCLHCTLHEPLIELAQSFNTLRHDRKCLRQLGLAVLELAGAFRGRDGEQSVVLFKPGNISSKFFNLSPE